MVATPLSAEEQAARDAAIARAAIIREELAADIPKGVENLTATVFSGLVTQKAALADARPLTDAEIEAGKKSPTVPKPVTKYIDPAAPRPEDFLTPPAAEPVITYGENGESDGVGKDVELSTALFVDDESQIEDESDSAVQPTEPVVPERAQQALPVAQQPIPVTGMGDAFARLVTIVEAKTKPVAPETPRGRHAKASTSAWDSDEAGNPTLGKHWWLNVDADDYCDIMYDDEIIQADIPTVQNGKDAVELIVDVLRNTGGQRTR